MMGHRVETNHRHQWELIGAGLLIGIWVLGPVSITQAIEQPQPEKTTVVVPAAQANSHEADAGVELAQIIAQSDLQARVDELDKRVKELEKWVMKQISMRKQHQKDEEGLLNSYTGAAGF